MFQTTFIWLAFQVSICKMYISKCIHVPLDIFTYLNVICWTRFQTIFIWLAFSVEHLKNSYNIPYTFPNIIQLLEKLCEHQFIQNIHIHISNASISFPMLFKYIGRIHIYTIITPHKKCSNSNLFIFHYSSPHTFQAQLQLNDIYSDIVKGLQSLEAIQKFACKACLKQWDLYCNSMLQLLNLSCLSTHCKYLNRINTINFIRSFAQTTCIIVPPVTSLWNKSPDCVKNILFCIFF